MADFARAADLKASDLMTDLADAQEMVEIEESAVEHMNADHADAVRLYATKLLGEADGAWRVTGVDPDGLDLALGDRIARMPFPTRWSMARAAQSRSPKPASRRGPNNALGRVAGISGTEGGPGG